MTAPTPYTPIHRPTVADNLRRVARQADRGVTAPMGKTEIKAGEGSMFWTDPAGGIIIQISERGFEVWDNGTLVPIEAYIENRAKEVADAATAAIQKQVSDLDALAKQVQGVANGADILSKSLQTQVNSNDQKRIDGDQSLQSQINTMKNGSAAGSLQDQINKINARLDRANIPK